MSKFPTTRWSLIDAWATDRRARDKVYRLYARPVAAAVRRIVRAPDAAQDVMQGFFARLLACNDLARVDPGRGRFRTWLSKVVRNFALKARRDERTWKRGGRAVALPLDGCTAEAGAELGPVDSWTPEDVYARRQATEIVQRVTEQLERRYASPEKSERFQRLRAYLDDRDVPFEALAAELGVAAGALRQQLHRMKRQWRLLLHQELRRSGVRTADIDNEIRSLHAALL